MSYIANSMAMNEKVIGRAYYHWSYRLAAVLPLILLLLAVGAAAYFYGRTITVVGLKVLGGLFLFWLLIALWIFFARMIRVWTTEIAVTNQRFILKRGWLHLSTQEIALYNIEGVRVYQGFWGQLLGYGHVHVEGTGVDTVDTPPIAHPINFRRAIENAKFNSHGHDATHATPLSHITPR